MRQVAFDDDGDLLTAEQVMERLLTEQGLRHTEVTCVLPAVRHGNEWRFLRSDLEAWIAAQNARAAETDGGVGETCCSGDKEAEP